jgi:hypothetical protein
MHVRIQSGQNDHGSIHCQLPCITLLDLRTISIFSAIHWLPASKIFTRAKPKSILDYIYLVQDRLVDNEDSNPLYQMVSVVLKQPLNHMLHTLVFSWRPEMLCMRLAMDSGCVHLFQGADVTTHDLPLSRCTPCQDRNNCGWFDMLYHKGNVFVIPDL